MSYCPDCGKEVINPNAEICPNCGGRVQPDPDKPPLTSPVPLNARSPVVAAIVSVLVCRRGQIYNGKVAKGIAHFIIGMVCGLFIMVPVGFVLLPIWWVIGIIDAYKTAEKINANVDASGFFNVS